MRVLIIIVLLVSATILDAQSILPGTFIGNDYRGGFANTSILNTGNTAKKWSLTRFSAVSTSFSFFNGGSMSVFSVPVGLQLNRRLNNNLYAFAGVSAAPAYVNFSRSFMANSFDKSGGGNAFFKPGKLGVYSRAELGLQYINDDKTFSISGSIGIERSSYPAFQYGPMNNPGASQVFPSNNR